MGGAHRLGLQGGLDDTGYFVRAVTGWASSSRRDLPNTTDALLANSWPPKSDRPALHLQILRYLLISFTTSRSHHDPRPQHNLLGSGTGSKSLLQTDDLCIC